MPTIFDNRNTMDQTVRIYDAFYDIDVTVNAAEFDIVLGFFREVCQTADIAANYTAFLFRVAAESGIPVLDFLEDLQGMKTDSMKINQFLAFYLNKFRPKSSLYGVGSIPRPVIPVARNVVQ